MATNQKRLTFVVTADIMLRLDAMKQKKYYSSSQSEMIRSLLRSGLNAVESNDVIENFPVK